MACGLPGPRLLSLRLLLACSALAAAVGCAGIKTGDSGGGGSSGTGASSGSGGGPPGSGTGGSMASGHGGSNTTSGSGGTGPICDMFTVNFVPKVPTVTLLVDRSGSMFPCLGSSDQTSPCTDHTNSAWGKFQAAVLPVVQSLEAQVRFGFTSFTGTDASHGNMCPMLNKVPAALN